MKTASAALSSTLWLSSSHYTAELLTLSADGNVWNWTSADVDITSGSTTWKSNEMKFNISKTRNSFGTEVEGMTVTLLHGSSSLSGTGMTVPRYAVSGNLDKAEVSAYRVYSTASVGGTPTEPILMFSGSANEIIPYSTKTELKCLTSLNKIKLSFPSLTVQERCPFNFGDISCGETVGSFTASAKTISGQGSNLSRVFGETTENIFVYKSASIEFTSGPLAGLVRTVVSATQVGAGDNPPQPGFSNFYVTYTPQTPVSAANGATFRLTQGCDKTRTMCRSFYSNLANFGGFPDAPVEGAQYDVVLVPAMRYWRRRGPSGWGLGHHSWTEEIRGAPEGAPRLVGEQYGHVIPVVYGTSKCPTTLVFTGTVNFTASVELDPGGNPGVFTDTAVSEYGATFAVCQAPVTGFSNYYINEGTAVTTLNSIFAPTYTLSGTTNNVEYITGSSSPWVYYSDVSSSTFQYPNEMSGTAHSGTAHIRGIGFQKPNSQYPNIMVDVRGKCILTSSFPQQPKTYRSLDDYQWNMQVTGAYPPYVVRDVLTNPRYGFNFNDADVITNAGLNGNVSSSYDNYCLADHSDGTNATNIQAANQLFGLTVARTVDSGLTGDTVLQELMDATNSRVVYSRGKVYIIPDGKEELFVGSYADATGSNVRYMGIYYPPYSAYLSPVETTKVVGVDDLIKYGNDDPIEIIRVPDVEIYNAIQIKFRNMFANYNETVVEHIDYADSNLRGVKRKQISNSWITNPNQALWLARLVVDKNLNNRNSYRFTLGPRWALLEPTDILTLTEAVTGVSNVKVRINSIEENDDGSLKIDATEWQLPDYAS